MAKRSGQSTGCKGAGYVAGISARLFTQRATAIFARKGSSVLADESECWTHAGALGIDIHLPRDWITSLVGFIGS
jgi:hypothetical protein